MLSKRRGKELKRLNELKKQKTKRNKTKQNKTKQNKLLVTMRYKTKHKLSGRPILLIISGISALNQGYLLSHIISTLWECYSIVEWSSKLMSNC